MKEETYFEMVARINASAFISDERPSSSERVARPKKPVPAKVRIVLSAIDKMEMSELLALEKQLEGRDADD